MNKWGIPLHLNTDWRLFHGNIASRYTTSWGLATPTASPVAATTAVGPWAAAAARCCASSSRLSASEIDDRRRPPYTWSTSSSVFPFVSRSVAAANADPTKLTDARMANASHSPETDLSGSKAYEQAAPELRPTKLQRDAAMLRTCWGKSSALRMLGTQPQPNE